MSRYTPPLGEWGESHFEYLKVFLGEVDVLYTPILVIKVPKPLFQPLFRAQLAGEQTKAARMSPSMVSVKHQAFWHPTFLDLSLQHPHRPRVAVAVVVVSRYLLRGEYVDEYSLRSR